jgi:hypothetical protein
MSALGSVIGGAETVIGALLDVAGPDATRVAYVGWQDGPIDDLDVLASGDRELVLAEQPTYDPTVGHAHRETVASRKRSGPGTVTLVHHAEAVARVEGKRQVEWRCPVEVGWKRGWITSNTSPGPPSTVAPAARRRPHGAGTGHVIDTRTLTETAVELIEAAFGVPGAEVQE